jgi:hypothetical protein
MEIKNNDKGSLYTPGAKMDFLMNDAGQLGSHLDKENWSHIYCHTQT